MNAVERHTERIRLAEMDDVRRLLPPPPLRVLEIGAGSGWQAAELARAGYAVTAVDVQPWPSEPYHPVTLYDGAALPFPDAAFDVVFSSNVLEHIRELDRLQLEICRVLAPEGRAIHVVPSPWWRLWTMATHYCVLGRLVRSALAHLRSESETARRLPNAIPTGSAAASPKAVGAGRIGRWVLTLLLSPRHGERGNRLSEAWYFRAAWWRRHFTANGFAVIAERPGGLAYTGNTLLGSRLSIAARRRLAAVTGSATRLFVLRARR